MNKNLHHKDIMNHLEGLNIPWEKNKEETFRDLDPILGKEKERQVPIMKLSWVRAAAAIAIILIGTTLFVRLYERNIQSSNGEYLTHQLPDGSIIEMNSASKLSYNPYWWGFSRKLKFEGEAYFVVQKGKSFSVESETAITRVLGTSFSVLSRNHQYKVICHTGKVEVLSQLSNESTQLEPNDEVNLVSGKIQKLNSVEVLPDPVPWKTRLFEYTGTKITEVLEELQRQYNIDIDYPYNLNYYYTGELNLNRDIETSLNLVCKPFKINFVKISEGIYKLVEDPEKN